MELEQEYITETQETPSMSVYKLDNEDSTKTNDDNIILFRNKIYVIKKHHYSLWSIYEYFSSINKTREELGVTNLLFMLHTDTHKLDEYSDEFKGITYDAFMSEKQQITEAEVPQKIMECLVNLQHKNVAKLIPYEKIKEAEVHHLKALQTDIDNHINSLMINIYKVIDKSKTPVEKIKYPYIAYEHTIKNGVKIYYKFPNTDGVLRPTFKEYFDYLFQKLHPLTETADISDQTSINEFRIYELLKNKYPFLQIDYVGAPNYIEVYLPLQKVLH
jgi:hypothetical protein